MIFQLNYNIMKHTIIAKLHQSIYLFTAYVYTMHNNTSESINAVKNSLKFKHHVFFCTKLFPDSDILVCLFYTHDLTTYFLKKTIYKSSKKKTNKTTTITVLPATHTQLFPPNTPISNSLENKLLFSLSIYSRQEPATSAAFQMSMSCNREIRY